MKQPFGQWLFDFSDQYPQLVKPLRRPALAVFHRLGRKKHQQTSAWFANLARMLTEDPQVAVPDFRGRFYMDARSALFRRVVSSGHYEPELSRLCAQYCDPRRDVLDIGANIGLHAVLFAQLSTAGRVLAVEPTHKAFARLQRNLALNAVEQRVIPVHAAVSDSAGMLDIRTIAGKEEFSSLGELVHPAVQGEAFSIERVAAVTVDDLVASHDLNPGFMKVDVEGAEHLVFGGATRTLTTHRPVILAELSDPLLRRNGSSSAAVVAMLRRHDYRIVDALRPRAEPGTREFGDILCTPC